MTSGLVFLFTAVVCAAVVAVVGSRYHFAQRERMKQGKEILGRYNPERSEKPLAL
jgi:hypothetical protein